MQVKIRRRGIGWVAVIALVVAGLVVPTQAALAYGSASASQYDPVKDGIDGSLAPMTMPLDNSLEALLMAGKCPADATASFYCLKSVKFEDATTHEMADATYIGLAPVVSDLAHVSPDPATGLPEGWSPTLWHFPGRINAGGSDTYMVTANLDVQTDPDTGMWGPVRVNNNPPVTVMITPYVTGDPGIDDPACRNDMFSQYFLWGGNGSCTHVTDFAEDFRIQFDEILPKYVGGWFAGRLDQPTIHLTEFNDTSNLLTIQAGTVLVPRIDNVDLRPSDNSVVTAIYGDAFALHEGDPQSIHWGFVPFGKVPLLAPKLADKAQSTRHLWNFSQFGRADGACYSSAGLVQAFVTTNAMQYQSTPPVFDNATNTFNFALSGLHYLPNGNVTSGSYDFVVRRDLLSCLYGDFDFSASPTVTVSDGSGNQVGVTVAEARDPDMIRISIDGFHFSNPTAKIKFNTPTTSLRAFSAKPTPRFTGITRAASTLTADAGTWASGTQLRYQWMLDGHAISGATQSSYTPSTSAVRHLLSVKVTASKSGYRSVSQQSIGKVVGPGRALQSAPVPAVSGLRKVGSVLTATSGSWDSGASLRYQWYRGLNAITGATASTYKLAPADFGQSITVQVTGSKTGFLSTVRESVAGDATAAGTFARSPIPTLTGTKRVNYTLTANSGTWDSGTTLTYQWLRNGVEIPSANKSSYKLTTADRSNPISVRVTGTKAGYETVSRVSVATANIAN